MDPDDVAKVFRPVGVPLNDQAISLLQNEVEARRRQQTALAELGQAALTGIEISILLGQACALVEQDLDVLYCGIAEQTSSGWQRRAAISVDPLFSGCPICTAGDDSLLSYAAVVDGPTTFDSLANESRFSAVHVAQVHRVTNGAAIPIRSRSRLFGLLTVFTDRRQTFDPFDIQFLGAVANILGEAIESSRTEEALRGSEWRLKQLVAVALDAVISVDREGRIFEWNRQAEEIFGIDAGEALGKSLETLSVCDELHLEISRCLAAGDDALLNRRFESHGQRINGDEFPVELTITASGTGERFALTTFLRDITSQKLYEQTLRVSEREYRGLFEHAHDAILIIDPEAEIVLDVNDRACEIYGLSREKFVGLSLTIISVDGQRGRALVDATLTAHTAQNFETTQLRSDGTPMHLEVNASQVSYRGRTAILSINRDVTARKRAELALLESERRFRALVENSSEAIATFDRDGRITYAGPSTEKVLGYRDREFVGMNIFKLVHPSELKAAHEAMTYILENPADEIRRETRIIGKDGGYHWIEATTRNLLDEPAVGALVVNYRDVSERRRAQQQLDHRVHYDLLTDLPNRVLFRDRLTVALSHARRSGRGVAVICLDLDHFKEIIDSLGHTIGDRVLQQVAGRLRNALRSDDTISRAGGDEFSIALMDVDRGEDALVVARKLLECLARPISLDGNELFITASIGVSLFPGDGEDVESLLQHADSAMYRAKELGRSNAQPYTSAIHHRIARRLTTERHLRRALEGDELELYYQPIIEVATGRVRSVEALLRWNDPKRGLVNPSEFIGLAEETRLILPIGERVLRSAIKQMTSWKIEGIDLSVSVNVSAHQLQSRDFVALVGDLFEENALGAGSLQLEITESVAVQNLAWSNAVLRELKDRGVQIAVDDFGTGQSSLVYLKRLPIDTIKIDRAFIGDFVDEPEDAMIVASIIHLAHSLGLLVVAEGVETKEQFDFLAQHDCDYVQGYYFSKPLPAGELTTFMRTR